ncbi:MAG: helix-turn-helix domain-containing protein [Haloechinothrix sp.]
MDRSLSPTMRRKRLGAELRRLRKEATVSPEQAAEALDCAPSRIGHIETGRNSLRKPDLTVLLDLYDVSQEVREALEETRREGARRGWWATYRLPKSLQTYVGMEADAVRLRTVAVELIPGLLQTRAYARRTHELATHLTSPDEVDLLAEARMRRQQRLNEPEPLAVDAVISEAALRRTCGEPGIAADQLRHLARLADLPNITVRVVGLDDGLHPCMAGSITVLHFDADVSLPVGYYEYAIGGHLIDDQNVVSKLDQLCDIMAERAASEEASRQLIIELAEQAEGQ